MRRLAVSFTATVALGAMLAVPASVQQVSAQQLFGSFDSTERAFVTALPQDLPQIAAGRSAVIDLRFRVASGMHINSHRPMEEYLIPTTLTLVATPGVEWGEVEYPSGEERTFAFSTAEKLDVYTGDITLHVHLRAKPGVHTLDGSLRYQACDNRACYPPRTIPVRMILEAK